MSKIDLFICPNYEDGTMYFNGNDAVTLENLAGDILDIIGKIGEDPGEAWSDASGHYWTKDQTLIRKPTVTSGFVYDPNEDYTFDPSIEWDSLPANTFTHLGTHNMTSIDSLWFEQEYWIYPSSGSTYNLDSTMIFLPNAFEGQYYEETISFYASDILSLDINGETFDLPFISAVIDNVVTPEGIIYECNIENCMFTPYSLGEIILSGIPTFDAEYSLDITAIVTVNAAPLGLPMDITFPIPYDGSNALLNMALGGDYSEVNSLMPTFFINVIGNIVGCTDAEADNFNIQATESDDSCEFTACPYPNFVEYNPNYTIADGSLCLTQIVEGCTIEAAENYNIDANLNDGTCVIYGCMNSEADNFNSEATIQDDSCILYGCTNQTAENYDNQANENNGTCIIYGCTVSIFPNYNPEATVEDLSCSFEGLEVFGCTDDTALNYYSLANVDNGTCTYDVSTVGCDYSVQEVQIPLFLPLGWSIFGFTCIETMDVLSAFSSISESILIVKDSEGDVYLPEWNFNGIGGLVYSCGYQIKTSEVITGFSFCPTFIVSE
jgi:hypothetical protein